MICAWQLVKALSGETAPGIGGVVTQVQAQVSTLGWRVDDLLLTALATTGPRRLAISAKGNLQVTAAGLPANFVTCAWEQWRDQQGPFNRNTDGLALATLGTHQVFDAAWREVKNACSGTDTGDALVELVVAALSSDAQGLSQNTLAWQALVEIAAPLAAKNMPTALALQERIKQLR